MLDPVATYEETRRALAHLDDPLYLENLRLASQLYPCLGMPDLSQGQALRRAMRLTIDTLDPARTTTRDPIDATAYQVLFQYAISRRSVIAIADSLDVSERKAYYDLAQASQAVARILYDLMKREMQAEGAAGGAAGGTARVRKELDRLSNTSEQNIDLAQLAREAIHSVRPLAEENDVRLDLAVQRANCHVSAKRVMVRQAILNLLSAACTKEVKRATVRLAGHDQEILLSLELHPGLQNSEHPPGHPLPIALQILDALSFPCTRIDEGTTLTRIEVRIPASKRSTVLVVDDNDGLIALFRRFLRRQPYIVHAAHDYPQALEALRKTSPDVVILDIMLPNHDGWEVLQGLKRSATGYLPVVICSIIDDPRLAASMGADGYLHKPVSRAALLEALRRALQPEG